MDGPLVIGRACPHGKDRAASRAVLGVVGCPARPGAAITRVYRTIVRCPCRARLISTTERRAVTCAETDTTCFECNQEREWLEGIQDSKRRVPRGSSRDAGALGLGADGSMIERRDIE